MKCFGWLNCFKCRRRKAVKRNAPMNALHDGVQMATDIGASVAALEEGLKLASNTAFQLCRLLRFFTKWIHNFTGLSTLLIQLRDAFESRNERMPGKLWELNEVLQRCRQLMERCAKQIRKCTAMAKGGDADRVRDQLQSGELDLHRVRRFIKDFNDSLDDAKQTLREFEGVRCNKAAEMVKEETNRLEDEMKSLRKGKIRAESFQVAGRVVGGSLSVFALIATVFSGGVLAATVTVASFASLAASEAHSRKLIDNISDVLTRMQALATGFEDVYDEIQSVQTAMHRMSEHVHQMDSNLDTVKQVLLNPGRYVVLGVSDALEELLSCIVDVGCRYS